MAKQKFTPIPDLSLEFLQRFWKYIDVRGPDECWPWTGARAGGYGHIGINKTTLKATRIIHYITTGKDPGPLRVRHTCDNPPCCNPNHHVLGSQVDNMHDADERGRLARGERASQSKLKPEQVLEIRRRYANGESRTKLAREFSISYPSVYYIVKRITWSHI